MASRLAIPSELYNVIKQQRALGRQRTSRDIRELYRAYLESKAARRESQRNTASLIKYRDTITDLQKEKLEMEKGANRISGITNLALLGGEGYKWFKRSRMQTGAVGGAQSQVSATPSTSTAIAGIAGSTGSSASIGAGMTPAITKPGITGLAAPTSAAESSSMLPAISSMAQPLAAGAIAGSVANAVLPGHGKGAEAAKGAVAGGTIGAAMAAGTAVGGPIGAILGAIGGGVASIFGGKGGGCIIISAATSTNSYEVKIARMCRDRYLSPQTLRGYYIIAEMIVPIMERHNKFKKLIKRVLVDPITRYGEYKIGFRKKVPIIPMIITECFLLLCTMEGLYIPHYIRNNGEVY